jgi:hypothetical protein
MAPKLTHALALAALCATGLTAHAESFYTLDSYADANGAGPDLVPDGGTLGGGLYTFGQNQGLSLDWSGFDPAGYTIELKFSFDDANASSGWRKIIDFKHQTADEGLYAYQGSLQFVENAGWNFVNPIQDVHPGQPLTFESGRVVDLVVTRNAATDRFTAWIDGVLQFSFVDAAHQGVFDTFPGTASPNARADFFIDDVVTGRNEASAGHVDFIRVAPVPLPATAPLMLGALAFLRRRAG